MGEKSKRLLSDKFHWMAKWCKENDLVCERDDNWKKADKAWYDMIKEAEDLTRDCMIESQEGESIDG